VISRDLSLRRDPEKKPITSISPGVDHNEDMDWMSAEEHEEYERDMEVMGFFSGSRLKLKSREITREHIAKMIFRHNERLELALKEARKSMPETLTEQQEGELIDLVEEVKELRKELRKLGMEAGGDGTGDPRIQAN